MEYLFRVLELTEFEAYLAVVALACELDHELALAVGYLNEQTGIRVPTLNLCLRMYTGDEAERLRLLQRCLRDWESLEPDLRGFAESQPGSGTGGSRWFPGAGSEAGLPDRELSGEL